MSTIKDVAKVAGVTVTTVSRVINDRGYISDATRTKVHDAMDQLGYQPNEVARALSQKRNNTLGVIVPHIDHPYFSQLLSAIEKSASDQGFQIMVSCTNGKSEKEIQSINMFRGKRTAGIILCSGSVDVDRLKKTELPLIMIECESPLADSCILCDNHHGGVLAAECLLDAGCKHLLCISGMQQEKKIKMPADERSMAFHQTCTDAGIPFHMVWTGPDIYEALDYSNIIEESFMKWPQIDGVFASGDLIAAQTIHYCIGHGKKVPDDIKIVGFDDSRTAALVTPSLSTIRQPAKEMAEAAVRAVVNRSNGEELPPRQIFPVSLIRRQSS